MILYAFLSFVCVAIVATVLRWRWGAYFMVAAALLQDPVRKVTPGAPAYLVMSVLPIWGAMMIGCIMEYGVEGIRSRLVGQYPALGKALALFLLCLIPSAIRSATYSPGSWQITVMGLSVCGSLIMGLALGYVYPRQPGDVARVLAAYCAMAGIMMLGAPIEISGILGKHPVVGTAAMGNVWVTYRIGDPVYMRAGFFRSPDVLGWHGAMVAACGVLLAMRLSASGRFLALGGTALGGMGALLCGRRKALALLAVFAAVLAVEYIRRARNRRQVFTLIAVLLLSLGAALFCYRTAGRDVALERFQATVVSEAVPRFTDFIYEVAETYRQAGFFGYGLGMATQGTQHIAAKRPYAWQEGGLDKVMAELGVFGFAVFLYLGATLVLCAARAVRQSAGSIEYSVYAGLTAILVANAVAAVVSAQIFGDPFVVAFVSFLAGVALSGGRLQRAQEVCR